MQGMRHVLPGLSNFVTEPRALRNRFLLDNGQNKAIVWAGKCGRAMMQQVGILTTGAVFLFLGAILIGFI